MNNICSQTIIELQMIFDCDPELELIKSQRILSSKMRNVCFKILRQDNCNPQKSFYENILQVKILFYQNLSDIKNILKYCKRLKVIIFDNYPSETSLNQLNLDQFKALKSIYFGKEIGWAYKAKSEYKELQNAKMGNLLNSISQQFYIINKQILKMYQSRYQEKNKMKQKDWRKNPAQYRLRDQQNFRQKISIINQFKNSEQFILKSAKITDQKFRYLNKKYKNARLIQISGFTFITLSFFLHRNPHIEQLKLQNCRIDDTSVRALERLPLIQLQISHSFITYKGVQFLLKVQPNLKILNLDHSYWIGDKTLMLISTHIPNLQQLSLQNCSLFYKGFIYLSKMKKLDKINLNCNKLSSHFLIKIFKNLKNLYSYQYKQWYRSFFSDKHQIIKIQQYAKKTFNVRILSK